MGNIYFVNNFMYVQMNYLISVIPNITFLEFYSFPGIPRSVRYSEVVETFTAIEGVQKVHNLRIWALSLDKAALSAHIAVKPGANTRDLLNRVSKLLASKFGFFEMTLQIEEMNASMAGCERCQSPLSQVPKTGTNP